MSISRNGDIDLSDLRFVEVNGYDPLLQGDVLFNNTNSPALVGKTTCIRKDTNWAYSNHMTRVRLFHGTVNSAWVAYNLHYLFSSGFFRMHCTNHVNQASINSGFLSERVFMPLAPLQEQNRIVGEIEKHFSRLDAGVAALKRVRANLQRYRAAVLKAACEGRLVPQDPNDEPASELLTRILAERRAKWEGEQLAKMRAKGKEAGSDGWKLDYIPPSPPEFDGLSTLPAGWTWTNIGSLFTVSIGGTPPREKPQYWHGGVPWVSSGEVAFCRVKATRERITPEGLSNSNAKPHPPGTVLLAMIGEGKTRGQAAILDIHAATNQNIASLTCSDTPIPPEWVFWWLMAQYESTRRGGSGGMQPALNAARVKQILIALPPLSEQSRIIAGLERCLSVVDELETLVDANLKRADRLRQAILKRAFEGKLVPQDPEDEPASVLLERIRAERNRLGVNGWATDKRMRTGGSP